MMLKWNETGLAYLRYADEKYSEGDELCDVYLHETPENRCYLVRVHCEGTVQFHKPTTNDLDLLRVGWNIKILFTSTAQKP